jgi:hypothetical protein
MLERQSISPANIPDQVPKRAVREPRFHLSDVQAVLGFIVVFVFLILLGVKVFECMRVCADQRDWDQALDPLVAAGLTAVGSVIGYFFGRVRRGLPVFHGDYTCFRRRPCIVSD